MQHTGPRNPAELCSSLTGKPSVSILFGASPWFSSFHRSDSMSSKLLMQDPIVGGSLLLAYTTGYVAPLLIAASFAGALQVNRSHFAGSTSIVLHGSHFADICLMVVFAANTCFAEVLSLGQSHKVGHCFLSTNSLSWTKTWRFTFSCYVQWSVVAWRWAVYVSCPSIP